MKRIILPILIGGLFCAGVNAEGKSIITGHASLTAPKDYAQFSVTVVSQCFPSRDALRNAHTKVVVDIQKSLNTYLSGEDDEFNNVSTEVGFTENYSASIDDERGLRKTVCQGTYKVSTVITFKTNQFQHFSTQFNQINNGIDEILADQGGDYSSPSTVATTSSPQTKICSKKREEVQRNALTQARVNAQEKFKALFNGLDVCLEDVKIEETNEPEETYQAPNYMKMERSDSKSIEITLPDVQVHMSHQFTFKYGACHPFGHKKK
jgi:uncharacterized protein YggE